VDNEVTKGQKLQEVRFDDRDRQVANVVTISELTPGNSDKPASADLVANIGLPKLGIGGVIDHETFESIHHPGKLLLLASWMDAAAADQWKP
jgi:hypothetical protein